MSGMKQSGAGAGDGTNRLNFEAKCRHSVLIVKEREMSECYFEELSGASRPIA